MRSLIALFVIASTLLVIPMWVGATGNATMSFDSQSFEAEQGSTFDVVVRVHPNGEALDTARAVVTYDPTVLSASGVQLTGAFERSAPGNYRDNVNGKVSWGGFTLRGAVAEEVDLITVSFLALTEGEATISISGDSRAIVNGEERIDTSLLGEASVVVAGSVEPAVELSLESSTHPNESQWYSNNQVELTWTEPEVAVDEYTYVFSTSSDAEPETVFEGEELVWSQSELEDGVYHFAVKGIADEEIEMTSRSILVDTTPPNPIELTAEETQITEGESVWLTFATTDETSGVAQYQIAINESDFQVQTSPLEIEGLAAGTYQFRVAALDRAGNSVYEAVSVRVYPEGTDLDRPEGYELSSESDVITAAIGEDDDNNNEITSWGTLASGIAALVLILMTLILLTKKRKP
jgi:hypothetical protein